MKTLIQGGTLITPQAEVRADLLIEGGRIAVVGSDLAAQAGVRVNASGKLVLPGGIDAHTHITLNLEGARGTDLYYPGTVPAVCGGTTSIVDHLAFRPDGRSLGAELDEYAALAQGRSAVDYSFHGLLQGASEDDLDSLEELARRGLKSVKIYMTYARRLEDAQILKVLERAAALGLLTVVHAEEHGEIEALRARFRAEGKGAPIWHARSRPASGEAAAVRRLLALAAKAGDAPVYIAHLSTASGLEEVRAARARGQNNIFVETCLQYLTLTEDRYLDHETGLDHIMSPPLRAASDVEALWRGLADGSVQVAASDHCAFTHREKLAGLGDFTACPGGAPGLEERWQVLFSLGVAEGRISLRRFVELASSAPARLFGLENKGELRPGADADLVILDPEAERTLELADLHGPGDYSLYAGMRLKGDIESVYLRGERVFNAGAFGGRAGQGKFLGREAR